MWTDGNGYFYVGDCREGDREADPAEIAEFETQVAISQKTSAKVTMRQARLALLNAGKLQQVTDALTAMQGVEGEAARIEWEYSNEVRRNQPLTLALSQAIGMTEAEMDQLFATAATL